MNLPRKDDNGTSYLSYSQIALFKRSRKEYRDRYIIGEKFEGNAYTDFGSKVGEAIENNDFSKFKKKEQSVLKKVTRLDEFEREVRLEYDGFYIKGFIDSNSSDFTHIIDYKTGGKNKEGQYKLSDYTQLPLYALSLRQETGVTPTVAEVNFIRRGGNAFRGEKLFVEAEDPLMIEVDISYNRLKSVYWGTLLAAKEIARFYELELKKL